MVNVRVDETTAEKMSRFILSLFMSQVEVDYQREKELFKYAKHRFVWTFFRIFSKFLLKFLKTKIFEIEFVWKFLKKLRFLEKQIFEIFKNWNFRKMYFSSPNCRVRTVSLSDDYCDAKSPWRVAIEELSEATDSTDEPDQVARVAELVAELRAHIDGGRRKRKVSDAQSVTSSRRFEKFHRN